MGLTGDQLDSLGLTWDEQDSLDLPFDERDSLDLPWGLWDNMTEDVLRNLMKVSAYSTDEAIDKLDVNDEDEVRALLRAHNITHKEILAQLQKSEKKREDERIESEKNHKEILDQLQESEKKQKEFYDKWQESKRQRDEERLESDKKRKKERRVDRIWSFAIGIVVSVVFYLVASLFR